MLALVTGATGMLGSHLVDRLLDEGVGVRVLARSTSDTTRLTERALDIVRGEWDDAGVLSQAVSGVDLVFHIAGYLNLGSMFGVPGDSGPYQQTNVAFTQAFLDASREGKVRRFVYCSSGSVYGPHAVSPIREDAALQPTTHYGHSKRLAEQAVRAAQTAGLATTIVRPALVYGPRDRHFTPALVRLAQVPFLPLPYGGRRGLDLVYAGDAAALMWAASQHPTSDGRVYNTGSGHAMALKAMVQIFKRVVGRAPLVVPITPAVLRLFRGTASWYLRRFAPGLEALLTDTGLAYMKQDMVFDVTRARSELGFTPQVGFEDGLRRALLPEQHERLGEDGVDRFGRGDDAVL